MRRQRDQVTSSLPIRAGNLHLSSKTGKYPPGDPSSAGCSSNTPQSRWNIEGWMNQGRLEIIPLLTFFNVRLPPLSRITAPPFILQTLSAESRMLCKLRCEKCERGRFLSRWKSGGWTQTCVCVCGLSRRIPPPLVFHGFDSSSDFTQ